MLLANYLLKSQAIDSDIIKNVDDEGCGLLFEKSSNRQMFCSLDFRDKHTIKKTKIDTNRYKKCRREFEGIFWLKSSLEQFTDLLLQRMSTKMGADLFRSRITFDAENLNVKIAKKYVFNTGVALIFGNEALRQVSGRSKKKEKTSKYFG